MKNVIIKIILVISLLSLAACTPTNPANALPPNNNNNGQDNNDQGNNDNQDKFAHIKLYSENKIYLPIKLEVSKNSGLNYETLGTVEEKDYEEIVNGVSTYNKIFDLEPGIYYIKITYKDGANNKTFTIKDQQLDAGNIKEYKVPQS